TKHLHSNTETTWIKAVRPLLEAIPETRRGYQPLRGSITFTGLLAEQDQNLTLDLFGEERDRTALARVVDGLANCGRVVDIASVFSCGIRLRSVSPSARRSEPG